MKSLTKYVPFFITILYISCPLVQANSWNYNPNNYITPTYEAYKELQSVTYQVEVNFSLTHSYPASSEYWFKFSRFDNRTPNSTLTKDVPPFQESNLTFSKITGSANTPFVSIDRFNNTYDFFNNTLLSGQSITLSQKYIIKLNEISFSDVNYSKIKPYNNSSIIFSLYCINETYYEMTPSIINKSYEIVEPSDNPIQKAIKICNWVSNYLTYDGNLPAQEEGAKWAFENRKGDCSEYSDLMITLLRCQGIPARKVTGYVISNDPTLRPYVGQTWKFTLSDTEDTFLGHAWVEYYVEGIGWIASDPTWNKDYDYVNRVDYLRLALNVGAWFSIPEISQQQSEFPNPCIVYQSNSISTYQYQLSIKAIETNLTPVDLTLILLISIPSGILVMTIITVIIIKKRRNRRAITNY
jgi:transglutaminase-like putative cysteine protease